MKIHDYDRTDGTRVEYYRERHSRYMERRTINDVRGETRIDSVEVNCTAHMAHWQLWDTRARRLAEEEQCLDPLAQQDVPMTPGLQAAFDKYDHELDAYRRAGGQYPSTRAIVREIIRAQLPGQSPGQPENPGEVKP